MFHTTLGSGAEAGFAPFTTDEKRGDESLVPLAVLATSLGREVDRAFEPGGGVLEPDVGLSMALVTVLLGMVFEARKVLFTETALKVAGFLVEELARPRLLSPFFCFAQSAREASVSEPPLTLTSAELVCCSSTRAMRLLAMSSRLVEGVPFRVESSAAASWAWST